MIQFVYAILHMMVRHIFLLNYSSGLLLALSRLNFRVGTCRLYFIGILLNDGLYILSKWIKLWCCIFICWKKMILPDWVQVEFKITMKIIKYCFCFLFLRPKYGWQVFPKVLLLMYFLLPCWLKSKAKQNSPLLIVCMFLI